LSLSYYGGGEKWIVAVATELAKRGHDVEIYALPFLLEGKPKVKPKELLEDIPYTEGFRHKVKADVVYVTYHPLSWLNFETSRPRIAGVHAQSYWQPVNLRYGLKPNMANILHKTAGYFELRRFNAVHMVTRAYKISHPKVYYIPNFVDASKYKPVKEKDSTFTVAYSSRQVWQKGWDLFESTIQLLKRKMASLNVKVTAGKVKESDMPEFLSSAHVSLLPSRVDTFGLAIVESLLCETPVVTTPLITHYVLDLPLIYGSNPVEFACEILKLAITWREKPDEFAKYVKYCRQEALKYDKANVMNRIEGMFKEVYLGCE
jgi:glycosyltransferase involved in cell wall biosynthesis